MRIIIIAGPNGAGKTTFANEFLPKEANCDNFVNADLIAFGLAPFAPYRAAIKAGRLMFETILEHVRRAEDFAFETTLSGRAFARLIPSWRSSGYKVKILFLQLTSPELAIARVRRRVQEGGHDIPEATIRRRYETGLTNFKDIYSSIVDEWAIYDNSGPYPRLIAEGGLSHVM